MIAAMLQRLQHCSDITTVVDFPISVSLLSQTQRLPHRMQWKSARAELCSYTELRGRISLRVRFPRSTRGRACRASVTSVRVRHCHLRTKRSAIAHRDNRTTRYKHPRRSARRNRRRWNAGKGTEHAVSDVDLLQRGTYSRSNAVRRDFHKSGCNGKAANVARSGASERMVAALRLRWLMASPASGARAAHGRASAVPAHGATIPTTSLGQNGYGRPGVLWLPLRSASR